MFIGYRNGSANWEWEFGFSVKGGNDSLLELKWSEKPDHKRKRLDTFFFFLKMSLCISFTETIIRPKILFYGGIKVRTL